MQLTAQQGMAMEMIRGFISSEDAQVFILKGYAGTGKTALIGCIVEHLLALNVQPDVMAPTGRAAKVLSGALTAEMMITPSTIHRRIYEFDGGGEVDDSGEFKKLRFPVRASGGNRVCIIDEASLISSRPSESEIFEFGTGVLIDDLLTYARLRHGGKIIFVGDPAQLPPVGDNRSVALDESFFAARGLHVTSFCLTDIVRQGKDSCILTNATMLRDALGRNERNALAFSRKAGEVMDITQADVPRRYVEGITGKKAIVCFSNRQAAQYNKAIRSILFPGMPTVSAGDRLMVVHNSYLKNRVLLNGDIITVLKVSHDSIVHSAPVSTGRNGEKARVNVPLKFRRIVCETEDGQVLESCIIETLLENDKPSLTSDEYKSLYISLKIRARDKNATNDAVKYKEFMETDPFFNAIHVKYGYAFTCHKAQGTEWDSVVVDFSRRTGLDDDSLRWKYTAVTRAKKTLFCVNLPDISPVDCLQVKPVALGRGVFPDRLLFKTAGSSPFHSAGASEALVVKYWSVADNISDDGGVYSIEDVQSRPYREIYHVKAPDGEVIRVDALYNKSGTFTQYDMSASDERLRGYFTDDTNIEYTIEYSPSCNSLAMLKDKMVSLCEETGVSLLAIEAKGWQVAYFLKTSGCNSVIRFFYNKRGDITRAEPMSEKGGEDEKLRLLASKLKPR